MDALDGVSPVVAPSRALLVVLLVAGALGAASLAWTAPFARFAALWIVVLVVPGLALADLALGRRRLGIFELIPVSFALSLLTLAVPATLAYLLRLTLGQAGAVALVLVGALLVAGLWPRRAMREADAEPLPAVTAWLFAGTTAGVAALAYRWAGVAFTDKLGDLWFHLSFVRKLVERGVVDPSNPFLVGEGPEFVYGYNVWYLTLAGFSRWAGVDPLQAWTYAVPLLTVVLLCAAFPLARTVGGARLALVASLAYVAVHAVAGGMRSLLTAPNPAAIAIWIVAPLVLAFFLRFVVHGERRFLAVAAVLNVLPAVLHFVEPIGVLFALALFAAGTAVCADDRRHVRRALAGFAVLAVVFAAAFALKAPLIQNQGAAFSSYAAHQPIRLAGRLLMIDPLSSGLYDAVQLAGLIALPLLFGWLGRPGVQLLVFVPLLLFVVQYNPLLATAVSAVTGDVFLRKGISFLRVLSVVTLAVVVTQYAGPVVRWLRQRPLRLGEEARWPRRAAALVIGVGALTAVAAYALYYVPALIRFGQTKLPVPDRHALKGFFVGPVGLVVFGIVAVLLAAELLRPRLGPRLRGWTGSELQAPGRRLMLGAAIAVLLLVLVSVPLLERRLTRGGVPYPRDAAGTMPSEYRYLREAAPAASVVLVKPRDGAFDQATPAFLLQALTPHYAVALPDPDVKRTKSGIDYARRFRDVNHVYSADATIADVQRVVGHYGVGYILASRGDRSGPLYALLTAHPQGFPLVHDGDIGVFRVAEAGAAGR